MPSAHARLSASSAARWMNCPGSIKLSERCPPSGTTDYAEEGTLAHAVAELKLRRHNNEITARKYNAEIKRLTASEMWCGEMDEATDWYADQVLEALAGAGSDAELMIEQRLDLTEWVPEGFGTADAVVIGGGAIYVIDLKYGKGVKVEAQSNPQLRLYALGASALFGGLYDFANVKTMILQPRLDHVSVEEMPLDDLTRWGSEEVAPVAKEAAEGSDKTSCGEWCRFCPAKAVCRTRAEANLALARMEFKQPKLLTADEIAEVLRQKDQLKSWAADVEEYALAQALAGEKYTGWKIVEGRSNRKYKDESGVVKALVGHGFDEAMLYERKLYGITAMEKLVGKKKLGEILGDLIVKPAGKPVLVPESDKREAINSASKAKEDFGDAEALPFN